MFLKFGAKIVQARANEACFNCRAQPIFAKCVAKIQKIFGYLYYNPPKLTFEVDFGGL